MLLYRNSDPCVPTFWKHGLKQREKMDGWMKCIQRLAGRSAGSSGRARESTSAIHHHHLWAQQYETVWNKLQVNRFSASYLCVWSICKILLQCWSADTKHTITVLNFGFFCIHIGGVDGCSGHVCIFGKDAGKLCWNFTNRPKLEELHCCKI